MGDPVRVLVNGAKGRMGTLAASVARDVADFELVGETDLGDDLGAAVRESGAQVVVDFTHHSVALECFRQIVTSGARPVAGTSGFSAEDVAVAKRMLEDSGSGGLIVPNFSVGVVLLMRFAAEAARFFPHVEVVEMHHDRKADAPSGTAERTAELLAEARGVAPPAKVEETERYVGARGARIRGVPVHSIRLPGALAHQEVLFSAAGEILTLRHDSLSRDSFRPGIELAIRRAPGLSGLTYGLEALL